MQTGAMPKTKTFDVARYPVLLATLLSALALEAQEPKPTTRTYQNPLLPGNLADPAVVGGVLVAVGDAVGNTAPAAVYTLCLATTTIPG